MDGYSILPKFLELKPHHHIQFRRSVLSVLNFQLVSVSKSSMSRLQGDSDHELKTKLGLANDYLNRPVHLQVCFGQPPLSSLIFLKPDSYRIEVQYEQTNIPECKEKYWICCSKLYIYIIQSLSAQIRSLNLVLKV